jgi:iron(III) transport system substrate-binding protein
MRLARSFCLAVALAVLPALIAEASESLLVYTALEADQLKAYKTAFEKAHPDIEIRWVRDSTGIITAKLLAEKRNPRADVIWGLAASSLMLLAKEGMLQSYLPRGLDQLKPAMRDPSPEPTWFGMDVWSSAICFNTTEAERRKLPKPASWADLVNPAYKGQIAMPNPASSGTGYLMVSAWIQLMGEEKAWKYMDALHQNVAAYTHSGSKPCRQAGAGEYAVGISFEYRANVTKKDGAPIDIVLPREGLGWDMEAVAIAKHTKKLDAAKKLVDWAISRPANELYAQNFAVVALPGLQPKLEFIPTDIEKMLIKNNFAWAADNRERILAEWTKRYDGKSEAKK